ncbi:hypothetical protein KFK09_009080 [Dendrobium nobile]|nr:hypothetical protein KFK09_009080 [Dendrobium nobile]
MDGLIVLHGGTAELTPLDLLRIGRTPDKVVRGGSIWAVGSSVGVDLASDKPKEGKDKGTLRRGKRKKKAERWRGRRDRGSGKEGEIFSHKYVNSWAFAAIR